MTLIFILCFPCQGLIFLLCSTFCSIYHMCFLFQAPYIIYVEVVEVEDLNTAPVQVKLAHSLRHTRSEENLLNSPASTSSSQLDLTATPTTTTTATTSGLGSTSSIPSSLSSPHLTSGKSKLWFSIIFQLTLIKKKVFRSTEKLTINKRITLQASTGI